MITIAGYKIDVAITEESSFEADVTEHPVEYGSSIVDHVRVKPVMLSIEGMVSDTPIGVMSDERGVLRSTEIAAEMNIPLPSVEAYDLLQRVFLEREPVTVETTTRVLENMVLYSLSIPTSDSDSLTFRASFKQVIFANVDRTYIPVTEPRAKPKAKKGTKPIKASDYNIFKDMDDREKSVLTKVVDRIR